MQIDCYWNFVLLRPSRPYKRNEPIEPVYFGDTAIKEVKSHKHLGMIIFKNLSWRNRVRDIDIKAGNCVDILAHLMYRYDLYSWETINNAFFPPTLEYGYVIMSKVTDKNPSLLNMSKKRRLYCQWSNKMDWFKCASWRIISNVYGNM